MKYKKSKYNYFVPYEDNQTILYNFYSNLTSLFDEDTLRRYNEDLLTDEEQEELYKRCFLIDNDRDELEEINSKRLQENLYDNNKLYRVWTTSGCNARCFYCFEKDIKVETLNDERCDKVIEYITNNIEEGNNVTIEWFGGEPLLNVKAIEKITKAVKAVCEQKHAKYNSLFITNGSLITPEIVEKMDNEWNVRNIQITLDGSEEAYNKIKDYYNPGKDNFQKVIDNIMLLKNRKFNVSIRLNYTEDNYEDIIEVIRFIGPKLQDAKNVIAYVYPIWSTLNEESTNKFISKVHADENILKIFEEIIKYNLNTVKRLVRINRKLMSCKSCNKNSCTILPSGNISKCSESFNKLYGSVYDGITDKEGYEAWSTHSIDEECKDCVFMPICQGGCEASKYTNMPKCFAYKPIIDDILIWYVNWLQHK